MDAKTQDKWVKKLSGVKLPIHVNGLARELNVSPYMISKVLHVLEAVGKVRMQKAGQTWLVVEVMK